MESKYRLYCERVADQWCVMVDNLSQQAFTMPYFSTLESAEAAIDKLGDRLNVLLEG